MGLANAYSNERRAPRLHSHREDPMKDERGWKRDSGTDDDKDGIRERPGDLKDDGQTRERRRDKGWHPDDEKGEGGEGDSAERG
jgi:hypothetical protein